MSTFPRKRGKWLPHYDCRLRQKFANSYTKILLLICGPSTILSINPAIESHMEIEAQSSSVDLSTNDLAAQITELAGHLNAANHRWLMLIAEFDRRNGWSDWGTQSCAHWLNWKCGIDMGAAREKVRVAHALESLPKISTSMARGELSYSKARAMTRVATPATEDYLLMLARHGTA